MNAKYVTGKSAGGLIDYCNNMREKDANILFSEGVSTTNNHTVVNAFNLQWKNSPCKVKDKMGHLIISFAKEDSDRLTDDFVTQLCQEYLRKMHFPPTLMIAYRHHDKKHDHVHIAYSRIANNGKAIKCDTNYRRSVKVCNEIRVKYGLTSPSWRKQNVNRDRLQGKDKVKYDIMDKAFKAFDASHNWQDFIKRLEASGVSVTLVKGDNGNVRGIVYSNGQMSFAGGKLDSELAYGNLRRIFGRYGVSESQSLDGAGFTRNPDSIHSSFGRNEMDPSVKGQSVSAAGDADNSSNWTDDSPAEDIAEGVESAAGSLGAALVEVALQPHVAQTSGGGGGGNNSGWRDDDDEDNKKNKPRFRRR